MKGTLKAVALTVALSGLFLVTGCDTDASDGDAADTSTIDVDSGIGGGVEVSTEERDYEFDGTVTAVSGDMVTIQHEEIADYKAAGTTEFKLASPEMAQYAKQGSRMEFKVQVTGEQALITQMDESGDADTTGADLAPDPEDTTK